MKKFLSRILGQSSWGRKSIQVGWGQQLLKAGPSRAGNKNLSSEELTFLKSLNTSFLQEEFEVVSFAFFTDSFSEAFCPWHGLSSLSYLQFLFNRYLNDSHLLTPHTPAFCICLGSTVVSITLFNTDQYLLYQMNWGRDMQKMVWNPGMVQNLRLLYLFLPLKERKLLLIHHGGHHLSKHSSSCTHS